VILYWGCCDLYRCGDCRDALVSPGESRENPLIHHVIVEPAPAYTQKRGRREMFGRFRERRKPETDSHVLMSLENADEGSAGTRIFIGQNSSSRKHRSRSDIPRLTKT
jgi:hypothetical protein